MNWFEIQNNRINKEASLKNTTIGILISAVILLLEGENIQKVAQKFNLNIPTLQEAYDKLKDKAWDYMKQDEQKSDNQKEELANYSEYIEKLKREEGFRSTPYLCPTKNWTIGYGHKILPTEKFTKITKEQAEKMLKVDALKAWRQAQMLLSGKNLQPAVLEIIAEMCFQMGLEGVNKFEDMWKALSLENPDYIEAAKEMRDSEWWKKQTRRRAEGLAQKMESFAPSTEIAEK